MVTPQLPVLVFDWQFDINNAAAIDISTLDNNQKTLFAIKDALVSFTFASWTVALSSDSVSSGSSDLWVNSGDIVWNTGNHSWIVLRKPTTGSQVLISCDQANSEDLIMSWSPGGLFTGGTISTDPTATDQVTLQASGNWCGGLTSFYSFVHVWHTENGSRTRVVVSSGLTSATLNLLWIFDEIIPIPDNWSNSPEVVCIFEGLDTATRFESGSMSDVPVIGNAAKSWDDTSTFDIGIFTLGYDSVNDFNGENWISVNEMGDFGNKLNNDAPFAMAPLGVMSEEAGFTGIHGFFDDLFVGHKDRSGSTYPISTTVKLWAQAGDVIMPWPGDDTIPLFNVPVIQIDIIDESVNNNHATPISMENSDFVSDTSGGVSTVASSLSIGGNEYAVVGDVHPLKFERTDTFSLSVWFKTSAATGTRVMITNTDSSPPNNGWELFMDGSTGKIGFQLTNTTTTNHMRVDTVSTGFNDGMWHQVVATWDGDVAGGVSGANIYIDGSNEALATVADTLTGTIVNTSPVQFGARDTFTFDFEGILDDVAIYNKELTSGDITAIYSSGTPADLKTVGPFANMIGYWLMGEGVISTTIEENTINGVLIGSRLVGSDTTTILTFNMVGVDLGSPTQPYYHSWKVTIVPDPTGALAVGPDAPPFGGPLTKIYVSAQYDVLL